MVEHDSVYLLLTSAFFKLSLATLAISDSGISSAFRPSSGSLVAAGVDSSLSSSLGSDDDNEEEDSSLSSESSESSDLAPCEYSRVKKGFVGISIRYRVNLPRYC